MVMKMSVCFAAHLQPHIQRRLLCRDAKLLLQDGCHLVPVLRRVLVYELHLQVSTLHKLLGSTHTSLLRRQQRSARKDTIQAGHDCRGMPDGSNCQIQGAAPVAS